MCNVYNNCILLSPKDIKHAYTLIHFYVWMILFARHVSGPSWRSLLESLAIPLRWGHQCFTNTSLYFVGNIPTELSYLQLTRDGVPLIGFDDYKKAHSNIGAHVYRCDVCNKAYHHMSQLAFHKITHSDERPHVCGVCGKSYKYKKNLKIHNCVPPVDSESK